MDGWNANYVNNPDDDYNIELEILYDDNEVAQIYKSESGLKLKIYASENDINIPIDWLLKLLSDAEKFK